MFLVISYLLEITKYPSLMKKKCTIILVLSWLLPIIIFAQTSTIKGNITDVTTSESLIGATIIIKDTDNGAITDIDGNFSLPNVATDAILVVSFVGYETQEILVDNTTYFDIALNPSAEALSEYVVVGYGKQEKKVATGAISQISAENIEGIKVANVQSALEGQVTGLIVNESSGQPGASKTILIRGISTNGDNSPLFLVDGLQVYSIDNISPGDVETIDVLKDAASCAIYGARAANGVVIITTKKGKNAKGGNITYEGFTSIAQPWKLPEMLGKEDYLMLTNEKFANSGQLGSLETLGFPGDETASLPDTDWMDVIFTPASTQNHRLAATVKNAFVSLGYWNQEGVVGGKKANYTRYSLRLNSQKEINPYINVGENIFINRVDNQNIGVNNAFGTIISDAFAYDPITEVYNEDKQYGYEQSNWVQKEYINPLSRWHVSNSYGHGDQVLGNVFVSIKPIKNLTFRSDAGIETTWFKYRLFTPDYDFHEAFTNVSNDLVQGYGFNQTLQFENYLNYNKSFNDLHNFDLLLGTSYRNIIGDSAGGSTSSIPDAVQFQNTWQYIDAGEDTTDLAFGTANVDYHAISYFGRVLYDFNKKYLFTATLRRDGSSNFGANNRWGLFPSFSAGWVISKEHFFQFAPISFLKLKASWGVNGNDRINPLSYAATIANSYTYPFGQDPTLITGAALATPPNPNIKWEESQQIDIGLEVELLEGKWNAEVDVYRKTTKDLLMEQLIPGYIGATNNPISNLGEIQNQGIELSIGHRTKFGDLTFTPNFTYTHFRNKVLKVAGDAGYLPGWSWPVRNVPITRMTEGYAVGHFVGHETDGIFQSQEEVFAHINKEGDLLQPNAEAGDLRFVDSNEDGIINSDDITDIGDPWPKHIFGLSLNFNYKGFDLSGVFSAQLGHQIFRAYERSDVTFTNYQTFWLDRWTPENPSDEYPRLVSNDVNNNQRPSDFYLEDASFLRLKNLQIGYNLPKNLLEKAKIKAIRVYFSANNLFTVTGYKGFDPDIGSNGWILDTGIDKGYYPANKTLGGGLKISF